MANLALLILCILLICLGILQLYIIRKLYEKKEKSPLQDELYYQFNHQLFQSVDSLKNSLNSFQNQSHSSLNESLDRFHKAHQEGLSHNVQQTKNVLYDLSEKFKNIDSWQQQVNDLTSRIYQLSKILDNNMLKGKFGELHLENILKNIYPSSWLSFQCTLENGNRVDCLITLGANLPKIPIDAKFPLATFKQILQNNQSATAIKEFVAVMKKNINDIHEKYLIPGVTTEYGIMFVPSDALFLKLCELDDLMDYAQKNKILICSPQTIFWLLSLMKKFLINFQMTKKTTEQFELFEKLKTSTIQANDKLIQIEKRFSTLLKEIKSLKKTQDDLLLELDELCQLDDTLSVIEMDEKVEVDL